VLEQAMTLYWRQITNVRYSLSVRGPYGWDTIAVVEFRENVPVETRERILDAMELIEIDAVAPERETD